MFACNIDRRGRAARGIVGAVMLLTAAALCVALPAGGWPRLGAALVVGSLGAFAVFESVNGWCAVRALGFKTWI